MKNLIKICFFCFIFTIYYSTAFCADTIGDQIQPDFYIPSNDIISTQDGHTTFIIPCIYEYYRVYSANSQPLTAGTYCANIPDQTVTITLFTNHVEGTYIVAEQNYNNYWPATISSTDDDFCQAESSDCGVFYVTNPEILYTFMDHSVDTFFSNSGGIDFLATIFSIPLIIAIIASIIRPFNV